MSGLEDALEYCELEQQFSNQPPKDQKSLLCMCARLKPLTLFTHCLSPLAEKVKQDTRPKVMDAKKAYNICEAFITTSACVCEKKHQKVLKKIFFPTATFPSNSPGSLEATARKDP